MKRKKKDFEFNERSLLPRTLSKCLYKPVTVLKTRALDLMMDLMVKNL